MAKKKSRTELREIIYLILFRADFVEPGEMAYQIRQFFIDEDEFTLEETEYVSAKVLNICNHIEEIDEKLAEYSVGWKVKRMNKSDLTALRLAYYEIFYDDTVPAGAAINEAVELAKNYGTDSSGSFVNGILAKVAADAEH
ncbi:MAG: transcription antitermination factor NusB [Parasporobacterium sp.]|nr:transcription antitermination factor NusB [Parasporobacterium sp.]